MNELRLLVEVPICAFRPFRSREYQDTYPLPPPSAAYGMLLSLVGEPASATATLQERHLAKEKHRGAEIALAVESMPSQSRVFRKLRRGDDLGSRRPDYQDLLLDLHLWLWLRKGDDTASPPLIDRVGQALQGPEEIVRHGGLSLGESIYLVDSISHKKSPPSELIFLQPNILSGFYSLPVWIDHTDHQGSILCRFSIGQAEAVGEGLKRSWLRIGGPCQSPAPAPS